MLVEQALAPSERPLSDAARKFLSAGRARFKTVDCFDFVPSDYELVWCVLDALQRGRFCEWGSGFGIATGLAEMLGFEVDSELVRASRRLLAEFGLSAPIEADDYLASRREAEIYFVYCWPGKVMQTEEHFDCIAPRGARLLICHGQCDIRCKLRAEAEM